MDPAFVSAIVGALGVLAGATLGLIGGLVATRSERKLANDRWLRERQDAVLRDKRLAVAEVTTKLAALCHSVMWYTSMLGHSTNSDQEQRGEFELEVHRLLSELGGAQYHLAALDLGLYEQVTPVVSHAFHLINRTIEAVDRSEDALLLDCNKEAKALIKSLPKHLGELIGDQVV